MERFLRWLSASPLRVTILNIVMLVALLAMVGDTWLFAIVGAAAILLCAAPGLRRAFAVSLRSDPERRAVDRLLVWIPGAIAIALGAAGLAMVSRSSGHDAKFALGAVLFVFELSMLAVATADLGDSGRRRLKILER